MSALSRFRVLFAIVAVLGFAGCATLPEHPLRAEPTYALDARPGGPLAALETRVGARAAPTVSGFRLLDTNEDGLRWRLALVDSARHSLDLQYYVWWGDQSGTLLMKRVIDAADRGVRVRLLLDDLSTMMRDPDHPEVRDRIAAIIDAHPNIEMRLFNAWRSRSLPGRAFEVLGRMDRINYRMHNKLLVADNRAAVIGGRNVGDEYFGLSSEFNFRDLDVLGVGPVARQASSVFDRFWNSPWVVPVQALGIEASPEELAPVHGPLRDALRSSRALSRFSIDRRDWSDVLDVLASELHLGTSRVHTDSPDENAVTHHMPAAIRDLFASAKREVLVTNAYIIPGTHALERTRTQIAGGVRFRMLTNSLASHDVPAVNSHYKQWRRPLLEAGVELHEIRPDAAVRSLLADTAPVAAEFMSLHVKAIVIDRERVFIGSMNLDPRSWDINSEMGVVIDSTTLARQLAAAMERDMRPENAWRLRLDSDGAVQWVAGDQVLNMQPARSFWQRIQDLVFMLFPRDLY